MREIIPKGEYKSQELTSDFRIPSPPDFPAYITRL